MILGGIFEENIIRDETDKIVLSCLVVGVIIAILAIFQSFINDDSNTKYAGERNSRHFARRISLAEYQK